MVKAYALSALAAVCLAALGACSDSDPSRTEEDPPAVASVSVVPDTLTLEVGGPGRTLEAVARDAEGQVIVGRPVVWTTSADGVAQVNQAGAVTPVSEGTATISAAVEGQVGRATVRVLRQLVASLEIVGDSVRVLERGGSVQLVAVARGADGSELNVVPTWETSDEAVALVSSTGGVVAGRGGSATVTARAGGRSASVRIRVPAVERVDVTPAMDSIDVGETLQMSAAVHTEAGPRVVPVEWASENEEIAIVSPTGLVTPIRAGTAIIRATAEDVAGRTLVYVRGERAPLRLSRADERPLPVELHETEWTDTRGVTRIARVVLLGGSLEIDNARYTQTLQVNLVDAEGVRETRVLEDSGEVAYDFLTGEPILISERYPGREIRGEWEFSGGYPTGAITLLQQVGADGPPVPLYFRQ